ncbi:hypothetical protein ACWC10_07970 [Streptomyces sp. NPDC001595]|uniref:hypothetical protein n=1 Tax=Streptomyces sp. NPDC001532 TaxID=3154520 RepID=UPI0033313D53
MTTAPYPHHHRLLDDPDEPGDLRALVVRVFTTPLRRPPAPRRNPSARPPLLRTET